MQAAIKNDEIKFADPDESLAAVLPKMKDEADYLVLLSYADPKESERLAKKFPDFNVVVTARGADEPAGCEESRRHQHAAGRCRSQRHVRRCTRPVRRQGAAAPLPARAD